MEKTEECRRYKWTNSATSLLISIWCHDLIQNQLKVTTRNQPIWDSMARYMTRKGHTVTGLQCKNRIKNLIGIYQDAVKKNDFTAIEPYYTTFKKVLGDRGVKKKEKGSTSKMNQNEYTMDTDDDNEGSIDSNSVDTNQNHCDYECKPEFLDINNSNEQPCNNELVRELEKIITKAIDMHTKSITSAMKMQTQTIEKLLKAERERLETIMTSEKESRLQLENKLDKILSRLDACTLPRIINTESLVSTKSD